MLFAWGSNSNGQIGDGSEINRSAPVEIEELKNFGIKKIEGNKFCSSILTDKNEVYTWGGSKTVKLKRGF